MKKLSRQEIKVLLGKAEKEFQSGLAPAAAKLLDRVLISDPVNAKANEILGYIYANEGNFGHALQRLKVASAQEGCTPYCFYYLGLCLIKLGRYKDAEAPLKSALATVKDFFEALHDLGLVYSKMGRSQEAIDHFKKCLTLRPDSFAVYYYIGRSLEDMGRYQESVEHYNRALDLKQDFVEARSSKGYVLHILGYNNKALESFDKVLEINPQHLDSLLNSGVVLNHLGAHDAALSRLTTALKFAPEDVDILTNIGLTLRELGRLDDAVKVFRKALSHSPSSANVYLNLGSVFMDMQKYEDAKGAFKKTLELNPLDYQASYNLGVLSTRKYDVDSAILFFKEARDKLLASKSSDYRAWSNILFNLNYFSHARAEALNEAQKLGKTISLNIHEKFASWNVEQTPQKLKIGFVSGDFREHPVARFLEGLVRDLEKDRFELYAFPTKTKSDAFTERLKVNFHSWEPIFGMGDSQAAEIIHKLGIHILFDLSGHTDGNRLAVFSRKPAPIQISWLGYFATTGLPEMDYFIGDPFVSPESEAASFTESIWNLPDTSWCFTAPDLDLAVSDLPCRCNGYFTFGSFAHLNKINDDVLEAWANVLKANPGSMILIKAKGLDAVETRKNLELRFADRGIDSARLALEGASPYEEYMETYSRVDIVLDTFPYPGGTTSMEAMWMGVPVLTMDGFSYMSRRGRCINMNASLPGWIARDKEDFVNKSVDFVSDPKALEVLRASLRQRATLSPLFDQRVFAKHFGEMLLSVWEKRGKMN